MDDDLPTNEEMLAWMRSLERREPAPSARMDDYRRLMRAIAPVISDTIKNATAPLAARIAALEARSAAKYAGVWKQGNEYREANLVTDRGALWICKTATSKRPGDNNGDFQLIVKSGQR